MINLSNYTNIETAQQLTQVTNNAVGGILINGFIIVLFLIILIGLLRKEEFRENALLVSSWVTFVLSFLLWLAKLTTAHYPLAFLALSAVTTVYIYANRRG